MVSYAMRWALSVAAFALAGPLLAQAPALVNAGKPMRVPFVCGEADIQAYGLTCGAEDPCTVYLELIGLEVAGSNIFISGNLHTAASTLASILLASRDEGKTWSEPYERIRFGGLEQIQFLDFETGWVAGQMLQAVPRDPFFLLTTDGGKTWRRRPVSSEGNVGAIEQYWFDSRSTGTLVIDRMQSGESGGRFALYESMTGGESWMVREVSTRGMRLKRSAGSNPDRRLRADAASKSFHLERRAGERWQTVASFLIEAGECRAEERPLEEPRP